MVKAILRRKEKILREMLDRELIFPTMIKMSDWLTLLHAAYPGLDIKVISKEVSRLIIIEGADVIVRPSITRVLQLISDELGTKPDIEGVKSQLGKMYLDHTGN